MPDDAPDPFEPLAEPGDWDVDGPDPELQNVEPVNLRGKFLLASPTLEEPNFVRTIVLIVRHDEDGALGVVVNRPLGVSVDEACGGEVEAARGVGLPLFDGGPCKGPVMAIHNLEPLAQAEAGLLAELDAALQADEEDEEDQDSLDLEGLSDWEDESDEEQDGLLDLFHLEGDDDEEEDPGEEAEPWAEAVTAGVWFCARREALEVLMKHVADGLRSGELGADATAVKFVAGYSGWGAGQLEAELAEGAWQLVDAAAAEVYVGGDPNHPAPPATSALPPGAAGLLGLLAAANENASVLDSYIGGVRQWVRLSTRASLSRFIDPKRIPDDPTVN